MESAHHDGIIWHTEILPRDTKRALDFLSTQQWLKTSAWFLAGGTALALYFGHRKSVDLDFFLPEKDFSGEKLIEKLEAGNWQTDVWKEGTIYGRLESAKASFIAYPFFHSRQNPSWYGSVRILAPKDIAVMKIIAISQRGRKRDFIDLYWYLHHQNEKLETIIRKLPDQYPHIAHDYHHILKALMYFADANQDPMPQIFFNADWRTVKQYFNKTVPKVAKEVMGLE